MVASVSPFKSSVLELSSAETPSSGHTGADLIDSHDVDTRFGNLSVVDVSGASEGDTSQLSTDDSVTEASELASVDGIKIVYRIRARTKVTFDLELEGLANKQVRLLVLSLCKVLHWCVLCVCSFSCSVMVLSV